MAKGGGRRTYARDGKGRFAAGSSGAGGSSKGKQKGPKASGGTLVKRSALKAAKAKLKGKDSADNTIQGMKSRSAQKGAVTRASNQLKAARKASRAKLQVAGRGTVAKPKGLKPGALTRKTAQKPAPAQPKVKRNRFLDPIARQILQATGQLPARRG